MKILKAIYNRLFYRPTYKTIELTSWQPINYLAAIYQIVPVDDQWACNVVLFLEMPTGHPMTDSAIQIPLNILQSSPEAVFLYIQALGNTFMNTLPTIVVYNKNSQPDKTWDINKTLKEQNIDFDLKELIKDLTKNNQFYVLGEKEDKETDDKLPRPTHDAPEGLN